MGALAAGGRMTEANESRRSLMGTTLLALTWVYVGFTLLSFQFWRNELTENDSCYHVAMAQVFREHGITRRFEWTELSIWKERYSDKEFLFHLALAPFCGGTPEDAIRGGKVFIALLGMAVFVGFSLIVRAHGIPAPWIWTLLLLVASSHWLVRLTMIRPHVLSIGLALLALHFILQGRWKPLAILGFAYSWSYAAPHLMVAMAGVLAVSRWAMERTWDWKPLAASAGGVAAGMVVHPYFPNNISLWWIQNVQVLFRAWGVWGPPEIRVGDELAPASTWILTHGASVALGLFVACNLAAAAVRPRLSWQALSLLALTWAFFLMEMFSMRFVEYFAPCAVLTAAWAAKDLLSRDRPEWTARRKIRWAASIALAGTLLAANSWSNDVVFAVVGRSNPWEIGATDWIRANVPPGDRVLHVTFDQFPNLFLRDRTHRYLVALDPLFGYASHPDETVYMFTIRTQEEAPDPREIARRLGGRYLVAEKTRWKHIEGVKKRGATVVFEDKHAVVLDLSPP